MSEHKQNMKRFFESMTYRFNTYELFSDCIELCAISLQNAFNKTFDPKRYDVLEKRYFEIIKRYSKDEMTEISKCLAWLVLEYEENGFSDVLGDLFMSLDLGNSHKGQFFTPYSLCRVMASCTLGNANDLLADKNYIKISEPACGAGATIIAAAEEMHNQGVNYQTQSLFYAVDVDIRCVHMCYVQLALLGIPAIIIHGNSLTLEEHSHWFTPTYYLNGFIFRKSEKTVFSTEELPEPAPEKEEIKEEIHIPIIKPDINLGEQMSLF